MDFWILIFENLRNFPQFVSTWYSYLFNYIAIHAAFVVINLTVYVALNYSQSSDVTAAATGLSEIVSFDFVIVGAGTAGLTVAHHLAEQRHKVLLIEAGGFANDFLRIPYLAPALHRSSFDWQLRTQPQKHACGAMDARRAAFTTGKGVGGSNLLNNLIYHRGHPEDYRGWFGVSAEEYDFERDVEPYFRKFEKFIKLRKDDPDTFQTPLGRELCANFINDSANHFEMPLLMTASGKRSFGTEISNWLKILPYSEVRSLVFDENKAVKRISGIKYSDSKGALRFVQVEKDVIISSGAVGSPKLLLHSGIGDCEDLRRLGLKCRLDLKSVGKHLQDHVATGLDLILLDKSMGMKPLDILNVINVIKYFTSGQSALASGGCDAIGWMAGVGAPQIQFMSLPVGISSDGGVHLRHTLNLKPSIWDEYFDSLTSHTAVSIIPILLHPRSEGHVRLSSPDPIQPAVVQPNYFKNPNDIDVLLQGVLQLTNITSQLDVLGARINSKPFPGCRHLAFGTLPYWKCYIMNLSFSVYHPIGTCRMGEVVDNDFRIRGMENLFVVDASVMRNLPSGNPNAAVGMLAFKFLNKFKI